MSTSMKTSQRLLILALALTLNCLVEGGQPEKDRGLLSKKKNGIRKYIEDKGFTVQDVPAAFLVYETLSTAIMISTLSIFLLIKPTHNGLLVPLKKILGEPKPGGFLASLSSKFMHMQLRSKDKFGALSRAFKIDALELATAYAECACFRIIVKPLLIPIKLFMVWKILAAWKRKAA